MKRLHELRILLAKLLKSPKKNKIRIEEVKAEIEKIKNNRQNTT